MAISIVIVIPFLLTASFQPSIQACKEESLLTAENTVEGVVISIFAATTPQSSSPSGHQTSKQLILPDHHLSPECGLNYVHCQNLLVDTFHTNEMQHGIIFIPLAVGLAVIEVIRDNVSLYRTQHVILRTDGEPEAISCSPSAVFKVIDSYFAVCTNQTTNLVMVFEVLLNKTSLQSTQISYPTNQLAVPHSIGNITNSSNFLHLEIDNIHEYIIFALGTTFYSLRPFFYSETRLEGLPSSACDRVHSLVPFTGAEFLAYCTEYLYLYDIGEEDWTEQDTFDRRGIPYQCPDREVELSVFPGYIQYNSNGLHQDLDIPGTAYHSGVCFGTISENYFAFQDEVAGVFLLDIKTSNLTTMSWSACESECFPVIAVNNRYLIVRDTVDRKVSVMDLFGERFKLIEAQHLSAPLAIVFSLECPASPSTGSRDITNSTVSPDMNNNHSRGDVVSIEAFHSFIILIVAVVIVIIGGIIIVLLLLVFKRKKIKNLFSPSEKYTLPIEEMQDNKDYHPRQETPTGRCKTFQRAGNSDMTGLELDTRGDQENTRGDQESDATIATTFSGEEEGDIA